MQNSKITPRPPQSEAAQLKKAKNKNFREKLKISVQTDSAKIHFTFKVST